MPFIVSMDRPSDASSRSSAKAVRDSSPDLERAITGSEILRPVVSEALEVHEKTTGRKASPEFATLVQKHIKELKQQQPDAFNAVHRESTERHARQQTELAIQQKEVEDTITRAKAALRESDNVNRAQRPRSLGELHHVPPLPLETAKQNIDANALLHGIVLKAVNEQLEDRENKVNSVQKQRNWSILANILQGCLTAGVTIVAALGPTLITTLNSSSGNDASPCSPSPSYMPQ